MVAVGGKLRVSHMLSPAAASLEDLLLVRLAATGGATRSEIVHDLGPLFLHKVSPAEWRSMVEQEIGGLVKSCLVTESRNRLCTSGAGVGKAARFLGSKSNVSGTWPEVRDCALIAKALGLEREVSSRLKMLARPDGLRALIVQKAFGLPLKKNQPPAKLRGQLAVVALERAFGNRIRAGFGKGSSLSAKAGRLLAGHLSLSPRDFATDAKLIAGLAAECVGAIETDINDLRGALLRGLGTRALESKKPQGTPASPIRKALDLGRTLEPPANDPHPAALSPPESLRPDLNEFAHSVKVAAATRAEGWPGNRKAYISHVWQAIRDAKPRWKLSEIEFKCMLAEAHRRGVIVLTNADLKSKKNLKDLESSAVLYKNAIWHFVRVEE